jgi:hypothetical protein
VEPFDRDIHDVDVMENVFRGVQLLSDDPATSSSDIVTLDVRAWLAGHAISAVHVTVLPDDDEDLDVYASLPKRSR